MNPVIYSPQWPGLPYLVVIISGDKVEAIFPTGKRLAIKLPDGVEDLWGPDYLDLVTLA